MIGQRCVAAVLAVAVSGLLVSGCSRNGGGNDQPTTVTTLAGAPLPGPDPTPRSHLADAVRSLLSAEQRGDHAASFGFLSRQSRVEYKDVADWTARRQQLPAVTGFRVEEASEGDAGDRAGRVVAIVEHEPGLDPFRGLSAAREKQTFTGSEESGGWLVDGDAVADPILPPDGAAAKAATAWAAAVQACDEPKAASLQAVAVLFGSAQGAAGLCGMAGEVTAGGVGRLAAGFSSADIVAQYSTDSLLWARVARITSPAAFGVVLAPIGAQWQVLGLVD